MSLENFQLPALLLPELYKNALIELENSDGGKVVKKGKGLDHLGNNLKQILFIVDDETSIYLPNDELNFLIDILSACKLSLPDVALINFNKNPSLDYKTLIAFFQPVSIICLGIDLGALQFPLRFPQYQVQKYNNQSYLSAPSLNKLMKEKQQKQQLWNSLKLLFSIK